MNLEAQQKFYASQLDATLLSVGESLITTFDLASLMDSVVHELPRLRYPACYVALYEGKDPSPGHTRLVLAYNENGRFPICPGGFSFPTAEIMPAAVLPAVGGTATSFFRSTSARIAWGLWYLRSVRAAA